jgi:hypothetical protein
MSFLYDNASFEVLDDLTCTYYHSRRSAGIDLGLALRIGHPGSAAAVAATAAGTAAVSTEIGTTETGIEIEIKGKKTKAAAVAVGYLRNERPCLRRRQVTVLLAMALRSQALRLHLLPLP